jgi:outer membrane biosynthesis protein TonB
MYKGLALTTVLSAALLAGCGGEELDRVAPADAFARDIKLSGAPAQPVEVVSPVELGRPEPPRQPVQRPQPTPRPAPAPKPETDPAPEMAPAPELVAVPAPAAVAEVPAPAPSGRELAPGQTVTVLPASTGPSTGATDLDFPEGQGLKAGGGHCPLPPRRGGRPIGIIGFR